MWHPHWAPWKNIGFSQFRSSQCHVGSNRQVKGCVPKKAPWALGTILDSKLLSFKWQEAVSDIFFASTQSDPSTTRKESFTTMSEVKVNQLDKLSQFFFCKRRFTDPIATNGALLEGFMFAIGWRKCSTKNEQFGLYGSLGKIENKKDEWQNQGANISLVGFILGQSLRYVADNLFEKILNCYKSLGVPSFDQFNYEADIPAIQGAFEFPSTLTFTMNGFKNAPHFDKDALLYALGWWFPGDKRTGQIQRDASKWCTGGKLIFPNEHLWIDLFECHGLIQVVWASSTFVHYTDPAQDNESTTLVGMSTQCSRRLAKTIC
ncbi:hypothetical protein O181_080202 [Austropuccinia psidii MF-1]|uniref:Tet-like 2OG-Fe(II) oxygenase domain-containing protein n=1 Tax=Austropuccinia psidii MF-1 TaxID=1389203 RepID=A0A9Q3FL70_9BASI|nr:hypothetical protein [Austropuccinia psidii MF-1]